MVNELWRDVPCFIGYYRVSNFGRVMRGERVLKNYAKPNGYLQVTLSKHNKKTRFTVHRLVMLVFVGKSDLHVNHIDADKTNNRLDNLEYCTQNENYDHARKNNLYNRIATPGAGETPKAAK